MRQSLLERVQSAAPRTFALPLNLDNPELPYYLPTQSKFVWEWQYRFRAYGGGLGNGKSAALIALAFYLSTAFPGNRGLIARWDGKELRQTTMADWFELVPETMFADNNKQMGYLRFKRQYGYSEIFYGDLKETRALKNYNLGWFIVDQAEEIDAPRWDLLVTRLRKQTPLIGPDGLVMTYPDGTPVWAPTFGLAAFNPEGTSSFIWRYFHPSSPEKKPGYQLYEATTYDGLAAGFVSHDYVNGMLALFPEQSRKRYLEGAWDVFEGRVYPTFQMDTHVIEPIPLSSSWKYYESIDHGLTNPTAVQWWAVTPDGLSMLIGEHYEGGGKPVSYHAQLIKARREQIKYPIRNTYLDPHCWAKNQTSGQRVFSIADEYAEHGIFPVPGQHDWESGFNRCTEALLPVRERAYPDESGRQDCPSVLVFATCHAYIKEKLNYRWKKAKSVVTRNEVDEPIDFMDHHMDAERYLFASRPVGEESVPPPTRDALQMVHQLMKKSNPLEEAEVVGGWMGR